MYAVVPAGYNVGEPCLGAAPRPVIEGERHAQTKIPSGGGQALPLDSKREI